MGAHIVKNQRLLVTKNGPPLPKTSFNTKECAKRYCVEYLRSEINRAKEDVVIQSFNTTFGNTVWPDPPPMPKCKPPRGSIKYTDGLDVFPEDK